MEKPHGIFIESSYGDGSKPMKLPWFLVNNYPLPSDFRVPFGYYVLTQNHVRKVEMDVSNSELRSYYMLLPWLAKETLIVSDSRRLATVCWVMDNNHGDYVMVYGYVWWVHVEPLREVDPKILGDAMKWISNHPEERTARKARHMYKNVDLMKCELWI